MISWPVRKLGDFLRIKHGYAFKSAFFSNRGNFIVLTPGNFREEGGLKSQGEKEKFYSSVPPADYVLKSGEMLVVMTDLTQEARILGSPAIVPKDGFYLHNQRLGKVTNLDEDHLDKKYLYHLLNWHLVREQLKATATGATVKHTAPDRIYAVETPIPPLDMQKRIASILSAYDDLIENNMRRIAILEEMARRLYEEWFVHFRFPGHEAADVNPENWKDGSFKDVIKLQRGFDLPKKERMDGEFPVFAATGKHGQHCEAKVKGPGIVTGRSGSLGSVSYIHEDFWPLNTTLWGKEYPIGSVPYAFFFLTNIDLKGFNSGAAVPTLNRNDLHDLPTKLPPHSLLETFDTHAQPMFDMKFKLERKNENLRAQRDLLLPKLITGEIDVSKAEEVVGGEAA